MWVTCVNSKPKTSSCTGEACCIHIPSLQENIMFELVGNPWGGEEDEKIIISAKVREIERENIGRMEGER